MQQLASILKASYSVRYPLAFSLPPSVVLHVKFSLRLLDLDAQTRPLVCAGLHMMQPVWHAGEPPGPLYLFA